MDGMTYHLQQFMAFVQVSHNDTLSFRNVTVYAHELAIFSQGINLVKSELVLYGWKINNEPPDRN